MNEQEPTWRQPFSSLNRQQRVVAILVALMALFVLFWNLTIPSLAIDEVIYKDAGLSYFRGDYSPNREHPFFGKQMLGASLSLLGESKFALRLPGAMFGLGVGLVLFLLGTRYSSIWAGLAGAAIWWALPHQGGEVAEALQVRLDRHGLLEAPMWFFGVLSCLWGWKLGRTGRWRYATLAGISLGLSVSTKFFGVLFLPPVLMSLLWAPVSWLQRNLRLMVIGGATILSFLVPYLLVGLDGLSSIEYSIRFQRQHARDGHLVLVADQVFGNQPWWSNFWFQTQYLGIVGFLALWTIALFGLWSLRKSKPALMQATAMLIPAVLAITIAPIKLPQYHVLWLVPLSLVAGIGLVESFNASRTRWLGVACGSVIAVIGITSLFTVASLRTGDYEAAAEFLNRNGMGEETILVWGYQLVAQTYLPNGKYVGTVSANPRVIIEDPVVSARTQGTSGARSIQEKIVSYRAFRFDRLTVYLAPD